MRCILILLLSTVMCYGQTKEETLAKDNLTKVLSGCPDITAKTAMTLEIVKVKVKESVRLKKEQEDMKKTGCHTDLSLAKQECEKTGKPLILWVGMNCVDCPVVAGQLKDAVNCHVDSFKDIKEPYLVVVGKISYWFKKEDLGTRFSGLEIRNYAFPPKQVMSCPLGNCATCDTNSCSVGTCASGTCTTSRR